MAVSTSGNVARDDDAGAAERLLVDAAVAAAIEDMRPVITTAQGAVADRFADLPADLRREAVMMLTNEIGNALYAVNLGFLFEREEST